MLVGCGVIFATRGEFTEYAGVQTHMHAHTHSKLLDHRKFSVCLDWVMQHLHTPPSVQMFSVGGNKTGKVIHQVRNRELLPLHTVLRSRWEEIPGITAAVT